MKSIRGITQRLNMLSNYARSLTTGSGATPLVTIEYHHANPQIAFLTLNTPKEMNALTETMGDEFCLRVKQLKAECEAQKVRAVILRGAGGNFSAGGNLAWLKKRAETGAFQNSIIMNAFYRRFLCVREIPVPLIAMVQGYAIGAGCCLTLAADVRLVTKNATLGFTFSKLGIHPGMGCSLLLPRIVSSDVANYLLLGGQTMKGEIAALRGLALEALEDEDKMLARAVELASTFAGNSPIAVQSTVRTLRHQKFDGLDQALQREADSQAICYTSGDYLLGIDAVIKKTPPDFKGWEM